MHACSIYLPLFVHIFAPVESAAVDTKAAAAAAAPHKSRSHELRVTLAGTNAAAAFESERYYFSRRCKLRSRGAGICLLEKKKKKVK